MFLILRPFGPLSRGSLPAHRRGRQRLAWCFPIMRSAWQFSILISGPTMQRSELRWCASVCEKAFRSPLKKRRSRIPFSGWLVAGTGAAAATEILAVAMDPKVLDEYESIFTDSGFRVGLVMPSGVACLALFPQPEAVAGRQPLSLLLKLSGSILTVLLLEGEAIRLVRCVDFSEPAVTDPSTAVVTPERPFSPVDDTLPILTQTLAYAEDEIGHTVDRLMLSGFGDEAPALGSVAEQEFRLPWDVLHSRFAEPQSYAGLLGLLERYAA